MTIPWAGLLAALGSMFLLGYFLGGLNMFVLAEMRQNACRGGACPTQGAVPPGRDAPTRLRLVGGYQPSGPDLDESNPPWDGSGVPKR